MKNLLLLFFLMLLIIFIGESKASMGLTKDTLTKYYKLMEISKCGFTISSGYRSKTHNAKVGGAKNSYHLKGKALDLVPNMECKLTYRAIAIYAKRVGFKGIIVYEGHIHVDTGNRLYYKF